VNDRYITESIKSASQSGARMDFADLLRRIEADGGQSTAPQMTQDKSFGAGRFIGVAAGIVAVAAISSVAAVGISSFNSKSECAMDAQAPMAPSASAPEESFEDYMADSEYYENTVNSSVSEEEPEEAVPSDSDVSGSDVSSGDSQGVE